VEAGRARGDGGGALHGGSEQGADDDGLDERPLDGGDGHLRESEGPVGHRVDVGRGREAEEPAFQLVADATKTRRRVELGLIDHEAVERIEERLDPGDNNKPHVLRERVERQLEARPALGDPGADQGVRVEERAAVEEERAAVNHRGKGRGSARRASTHWRRGRHASSGVGSELAGAGLGIQFLMRTAPWAHFTGGLARSSIG
jgi:hypothetical protein